MVGVDGGNFPTIEDAEWATPGRGRYDERGGGGIDGTVGPQKG